MFWPTIAAMLLIFPRLPSSCLTWLETRFGETKPT
jgi:hypothetical protein